MGQERDFQYDDNGDVTHFKMVHPSTGERIWVPLTAPEGAWAMTKEKLEYGYSQPEVEKMRKLYQERFKK